MQKCHKVFKIKIQKFSEVQRLQSVVLGVIWFLSPLGCLFYQSGTLREVASLSDSNKLSCSSFPVRTPGQKDTSWCEHSQFQPLLSISPSWCFGDYFQARAFVWLRFLGVNGPSLCLYLTHFPFSYVIVRQG